MQIESVQRVQFVVIVVVAAAAVLVGSPDQEASKTNEWPVPLAIRNPTLPANCVTECARRAVHDQVLFALSI